jgi:hypothetical protein
MRRTTKQQQKQMQDAYDNLTPAQQRKVDAQVEVCNKASKAYKAARDAADKALSVQIKAYDKLGRLYKGHLPADFFWA